MNALRKLYRDSLGLLTDLYQLTMAYAYWKSGMDRREAVFHLFFRNNPFSGGFALCCGLEPLIEYVSEFRFDEDDLSYLETLKGNDDRPLFDRRFLDELGKLRLGCDLDAVPEGTPVFPYEPLVRVQGSILQCQLLETPLLNLVNFSTLIATKAARVCGAAQPDSVIEFGLRRAQGIDGGATAARAAYIGGCAGTSNVLAGKLYGIPVLGTHAHSWIMCFDSELQAFQTYADALPNNCVFLVDTYDSIEGVRNAVRVGQSLRDRQNRLVGVRLDSGDLAELSVEARKILDETGFPEADIVASSDLDEHRIRQIRERGGRVDLWGVGTRLATAGDDPALGGVYKLAAVRDPGGTWQYRIKLSNDSRKTTIPGIQQIRRYLRSDRYEADMIYDTASPPNGACTAVDFDNPPSHRQMSEEAANRDLLVPVLRGGDVVYHPPPLAQVRQTAGDERDRLPEAVKSLEQPVRYPVMLEQSLFQTREQLSRSIRGQPHNPP